MLLLMTHLLKFLYSSVHPVSRAAVFVQCASCTDCAGRCVTAVLYPVIDYSTERKDYTGKISYPVGVCSDVSLCLMLRWVCSLCLLIHTNSLPGQATGREVGNRQGLCTKPGRLSRNTHSPMDGAEPCRRPAAVSREPCLACRARTLTRQNKHTWPSVCGGEKSAALRYPEETGWQPWGLSWVPYTWHHAGMIHLPHCGLKRSLSVNKQ